MLSLSKRGTFLFTNLNNQKNSSLAVVFLVDNIQY